MPLAVPAVLVLLAFLFFWQPTTEMPFITAGDGAKIAYDWYEVKNPKGYLVLTHMMPATKESWRAFAGFMREWGYTSIAIDLRGHGQSDGGPNGYQQFSDSEHQKGILDIQAAVDFLKTKGAKPEQIILVGASIGANLSLQYVAQHSEFKKAVLLSAGLDYRGVKTETLAKQLGAGQGVAFVAAEDDGDTIKANQQLFGTIQKGVLAETIFYKTGGHGTALLESHPDLKDKILQFLNGH